MRMTPEQYFAVVKEEPSPSLFYEAPRDIRLLRGEVGRVLEPAISIPLQVPEFPNTTDHTAFIIGVVAVVAIVGIVALGLAFFSRKG